MLLKADASRILMLLAWAATFSACCRRPTDARVVGEWKQPNYPARITFYADHTLMFDDSRLRASGTWRIVGDEFTVVLRQPERLRRRESVSVYSHSKICHDDLIFGPSREFRRRGGEQIGESDTFTGGIVYKRVR